MKKRVKRRWIQSRARAAAWNANIAVESMERRQLLTVTLYTVTDQAEFSSSTGFQADGGLIRASTGNLYGTTKLGGANQLGTVYKVLNGSNTVQTIASFNGASGAYPTSELVMDSAGNLYGTTAFGGANGQGTVFEVHSGATTAVPLASFTSSNNDIAAVKLVVDSTGDVYGVTPQGGDNDEGSIFEVDAGGSPVNTIASFNSSTGEYPSSGLVMDSAGDLFGTTPRGASDGYGSIYELPADHIGIEVLAPFTSLNSYEQSSALTMDINGNLYGSTEFGGTLGDGSIYELPAHTNTINTLASFNISNGANPTSAMIINAAGDLFGTTSAGGPDGDGTVFELPSTASNVSTIAFFTGTNGSPGTDGFSNNSIMPGILTDNAGNFYGVAPGGTPGNLGAVYELTPQVVSQVAFTQQPVSAVPAGVPQTFQLALETAGGTVDTSDHATISLLMATGPYGAVLGGTLSGAAVNGVLTLSNVIFRTAGSYTVTGASGTLTPATSQSIIVTAGTGAELVVTQQPTGASAGQAIGNTRVSVEDAFGNVITSSTSTINISSGSSNISSGISAVQAVGGVATFTGIAINKAGTYQWMFTGSGLASVNSSSFVVTPAAASQLVLTQSPLPASAAGQSIGPVDVDVQDTYGNIVTNNTSQVTVSASGNTPLVGTPSMQASGGVAAFNGMAIDKAGTYTLTVSDPGLPSVNTSSIVVSAGPASRLIVIQNPLASVTAGQTIGTVAVNVEDAFGNIITNNASTVAAATASKTPFNGTGSAQASNGVATFTGLSLNKAGTYALTVTDGSLIAANSSSFVVNAGPAHELLITQSPPASVTAGQPIGQVTVAAEDAYGNVITGSSALVSVTSNTALIGPAEEQASSGIATFAGLSIDQAGNNVLTFTAPGLAAVNSSSIAVSAAAASQVVITQQPLATVMAGQPIGPVAVTLEDSFGNVVTASSVVMRIAASGTSLDGSTSTDAVGGVGTFSGLAIDTAGSYTLTVTDTGLPMATTTSVIVTAGIASKLSITAQPTASVSAGQDLGPITAQVEDAFGNLITSNNSTMTIATTSGTPLQGPTSAQSANGDVTFSGLSIDLVGSYTLSIDDPGLASANTSGVIITPATASQLVITQQPKPTGLTGQNIGPVAVTIEDAYGNICTSDSSTVTLTTGAPITGTSSTAAVNGVAQFSDLSIILPGTYTLTAADGALPTADSTPVDVYGSLPTQQTVVAGHHLAAVSVNTRIAYNQPKLKQVTVSLVNDATQVALLTQTFPVKAQLATIAHLRVFQAGVYTMIISGSNGDAVTQQVTVVPTHPQTLLFTPQPTSLEGLAPVVIKLIDRYGNVCDGWDGKIMRLWFGRYPQLGPDPILQGTLTATLFNGTAVFPSVYVTRTGRARLLAHVAPLPPVESAIFINT